MKEAAEKLLAQPAEQNKCQPYEAPQLILLESAEVAGGNGNVAENTNGVLFES
ncbi:MAG: hypothetical protein P1U32_06510 [Legionellaceae bacterium]|nr:hypothetical protein [Legionellaceae bacterium]